MPLLIGLLSFATIGLLSWYLLLPKDRIIIRRRLGVETASAGPTSERRLQGGLLQRTLVPALGDLGALLARFLPHRLVGHIEHLLMVANSRMPAAVFLGIWAACGAVGLLVLFYISRSNQRLTLTQLILFGALILGMSLLVPYTMLRRRANARRKSITRALPDALDLLVTGVEAGLGVDAAFVMVTEKTGGPLSETFSSYLRQVGLGRSRRDALTDVAHRSGVVDLIRVAASVAQAEQMGAVLGDVLRIQAEDLRILRRQRAQERAQRAPVLMTIPMASCFLPAMAAVVIIPSALNLMDTVSRMGKGGAGIIP